MKLGRYGFHSANVSKIEQLRDDGSNLLESNAVRLGKRKVSMGLSKSRTTSMGSGEQRGGTDDMGRD